MSNQAVALFRCSTNGQAERGNGLAAQRDAVVAYAGARGLEIKSFHTDEGVSGGAALEKRTGLLAALAELRRGDVLLIAKYDRLARDLMLQLTIERMVSRIGARIVSVDNDQASGMEPSAVLLRRLLASVAEFEKAQIRQRTISANKARKARGLVCGHPPFGFTKNKNNELVEDETEQLTLNKAEAIRNEPIESGAQLRGLSWRLVAKALNEEGHRNRSGGLWTTHSLMSVFRNKKQLSQAA